MKSPGDLFVEWLAEQTHHYAMMPRDFQAAMVTKAQELTGTCSGCDHKLEELEDGMCVLCRTEYAQRTEP